MIDWRIIYGKLTDIRTFLGLIFLIYITLYFIEYSFFTKAITFSIQIIISLIPLLILIYFLTFIVNLLISKKLVIKHMKFLKGKKGAIIAAISGIISTGPIYMWYPLLSDFKKMGASDNFIVIFLYTRAIKLPLFPIMVTYFGLWYTIIFTCLLFIFSFVNGYVVDYLIKKELIK
jgi:uncharacterized membrane protein YraQ (UPF0718 family)